MPAETRQLSNSQGDAGDRLPPPGQQFVCSWSGGKDCCLAMHRAVRNGCRPSHLVTMFVEHGGRTRSHGLAAEVIRAQAAALGVPLVPVATSWDEYEQRLTAALSGLAHGGARAAVFGDIDIDRHRQWEENVCRAAGLRAWLPLWQTPRRQLLDEFLAAGFVAQIVAARDGTLDREFLGRRLDAATVEELWRAGHRRLWRKRRIPHRGHRRPPVPRPAAVALRRARTALGLLVHRPGHRRHAGRLGPVGTRGLIERPQAPNSSTVRQKSRALLGKPVVAPRVRP